jgi:fermentation-respiration switch protein FrsA (DUF1100 family)
VNGKWELGIKGVTIGNLSNHLSWLRMFWSVIGLIAIFYIGLTALLFLFQERLVYFPTRAWDATPSDAGLPYQEVWFEAADGVKLSGWFIPAESARGIILFFHGNGGNISHRLWSLKLFYRLGLSTFIIDYRGYGHSEGSPGESGTYLDAEAAWRYLIEEQHIPPTDIIIFGESLGGAVAAYLAEKHPPRALILLSSFTSVPDMGAQAYPFLPVRWLARIKYNTLERLAQINCPVLIVHSPADEIVPYSHGQQLFAAANEPKEFLDIHGSHNEGIIVSTGYEAGLDAFIAKYSDG